MRYYKIALTNADGSAPTAFPQTNGATWCSQINGANDPGALDCELDIQQSAFDTPVGGSFVRLYGVPLAQIVQSANLNHPSPNQTNIDVYVGMAAGLPLANPAEQGLVVHGTVFPAFGNWIGTAMTLDLILSAYQGGAEHPVNIVHNQPAGMSLGTAVQNALSTAFPGSTPTIAVSPNLILPNTEIGIYGTLAQYAGYVRALSQKIMGNTSTYQGVRIGQQGKATLVTDGTQTSSTTKAIAFQDLIGQPTWYGLNQVSLKTVMRGDIAFGSTVTLPNTIATVQAQSAPQFRQNSGFQGQFFVSKIRHMGRFRQPTGEAWVTVFDLVSLTTGTATT